MMTSLPSTCFDAAEIAPAKRYEVFREGMGVMFDVSKPEAKGRDFSAYIGSYLIQDLMLVNCRTIGQRFHRTSRMIAADGLDHILVQVYLNGYSRLQDGAGEVLGGPGRVVIIDASRPWIARTTSFENFTLVIPRRLLAGKLVNENDHHARSLDDSDPMARILLRFLLAMRESLPSMSVEDASLLVQPSLDLVVAALNSVGPSRRRECHVRDAAQSYGLKLKIKAFLEQNLHDPDLDVNKVIDHFNLSRSHLFRLFEGEGGVASYLRDRRLDVAYRRLSFPSESGSTVNEVAFSVGYRSEAAFSRVFKQRFGISPREARERGPENMVANVGSAQGTSHLWADWLKRL